MDKLSTQELRSIFCNFCILNKIPVCLPLMKSEWDLLIKIKNEWQTLKCVWTSYRARSSGFIGSIQRKKGQIIVDMYFLFTAEKTGFLISKEELTNDRIYTSLFEKNKIMSG